MIRSNAPSHKQSGNVLITALFIVSIAVIVCVMLAQRIHIGIARATILDTHLHAYRLASKSTAWSISKISENEASQTDNPNANTLQTPIVFDEMDPQGYHLHGVLKDAQGCFNVNNLSQSDQIEFFKRLMSIDAPFLDTNAALRIETNLLTSLLSLPSRQFTREDQVRTAIGDAAYFAMKPDLCIFANPTMINIQSASISLLTALSKKPNMKTQAEQLRMQLNQIHSIDDLKKNPIAMKMDLDYARLTLQSDYFYHLATVTHADEHFYLRELLHRAKQNNQHHAVHIIWRNQY